MAEPILALYRTKLLRLLDEGRAPFGRFTEAGRWETATEPNWSDGFWPGLFWLAWSATGERRFRQAAEELQARIAPRRGDGDANYDLGFLYRYSFALGYDLTGEARWRETALAAARRLLDFVTPAAGVITVSYPERAAAHGGKAVTTKIDVMMNLGLLWWAYRETGKTVFLDSAIAHARRSLSCLLRADGSVWELADFDPGTGALLLQDRKEGLPGGCWARAQAWAIFGFLEAAHHSGDPSFHTAALRALDYWRQTLPEDSVPYWDLAAEGKDRAVRDASSGAIVLAALRRAERRRIKLAGGPALAAALLEGLSHFLAGNEEDGVLAGGCAYHRKGQGLSGATVWGDYYLLAALTDPIGPRGPY